MKDQVRITIKVHLQAATLRQAIAVWRLKRAALRLAAILDSEVEIR